jgi:hypothetical protein
LGGHELDLPLPRQVTAVIGRRALGKRGQTAISWEVQAAEPIEAVAQDLTLCAREAGSARGELRGAWAEYG